MTLGQHQEAFSRDCHKLETEAYRLGYEIRRGEAERAIEQQLVYVRTGRSKTMDSMHLRKCAQDYHFTKDGKLCYPPELGVFWESLSPLNRWGGHFKNFVDAPHFERRLP